jgi:predicted aminopeptidase
MLLFAEQTLNLEVGNRYRSYVALDRPNVVWNLFAAPELSLEAETWCYPFVGCAPYRGYFDRDRAEAYRTKLERRGLETYLGGVAAYSTLGWFDDPLLSSFISLDEPDFAELLFHELAHSRLWLKGDATFNESFATFVGHEGMRQWLSSMGKADLLEEHDSGQQMWLSAKRMLISVRARLDTVYRGSASTVEKQAAKAAILEDTQECLKMYSELTGAPGYRRLMSSLSNAYLASLATYTDAVPLFKVLFEEEGGDWERFYARAEAVVDNGGWMQLMAGSGEDHVATERNDDHADQIQCEPFSGHGRDGEALR